MNRRKIIALLLILLWGYMGTEIALIASIGVLIVDILLEKDEKKINTIFFFLPWVFVTGWEYLAVLTIVYFVIKLYIELIIKKSKISIMGLVSIVTFITYVFSQSFRKEADLLESWYLIVFSLIFVIFILFKDNYIDLEGVITSFSISMFISCIVGGLSDLFSNFNNIDYFVTFEEIITSLNGKRFVGLDSDPNFLSFNIMIAIVSLVLILHNNINLEHRKIYYFILILLNIFAFLTLSNTFLIIWILSLIIYIYMISNNNAKIYFSVIIFIFLITLLGSDSMRNFIFEDIFGRLSRESLTDINTFSNGRYNYWVAYLNEWSSSLGSIFFGKGGMSRLNYTAHNTLLRFIYMYGLIGIIFLSVILYQFNKMKKQGKNIPLINKLPLIVLFMFTSMLDMFRWNSVPYLFPFLILTLTIYNSDLNIKEIEGKVND